MPLPVPAYNMMVFSTYSDIYLVGLNPKERYHFI